MKQRTRFGLLFRLGIVSIVAPFVSAVDATTAAPTVPSTWRSTPSSNRDVGSNRFIHRPAPLIRYARRAFFSTLELQPHGRAQAPLAASGAQTDARRQESATPPQPNPLLGMEEHSLPAVRTPASSLTLYLSVTRRAPNSDGSVENEILHLVWIPWRRSWPKT